MNYSAFFRRGAGLLFLFMLLLAGPGARAQAPTWQLALGLDATQSCTVDATASGPNGSVYLLGHFSGTLSLGGRTLTSAGGSDVFLTRWSRAGGFAWVQQAGGTHSELPGAIAVSGSSVYIVGGFSSTTASFGAVTLTNNQGGNADGFVVKLLDAGSTSSFVWGLSGGGNYTDYINSIAVNGTNLYVTGEFNSPTASFGSTSLVNANLPGGVSHPDVFIAKITDSGSSAGFTWAYRSGGTANEMGRAVAVSGSSVYLTGTFKSASISLGGFVLTNTSAGADDCYIAKLSDAGSTASFAWVKQLAGSSEEAITDLVVNGGSVYAAGYFQSPNTTFDGISLANSDTTFPYSELFVAKLTDAGSTASFTWAQKADGARGHEFAAALAVQGPSVYIAGVFSSPTVGFGSIPLTGPTASFADDLYVAKLTDAGSTASFDWVQQAGGSGYDYLTDLALTPAGGVYVTGLSRGSSVAFGSHTLASPSGNFGFVAALADPTLATAPAPAAWALALAPNPARHSTTLTLPAVPGAARATLTLRDALGRTVRRETVSLPAAGRRHPLDLTGLAPGLYALHLQAGTATAVRRLLVE